MATRLAKGAFLGSLVVGVHCGTMPPASDDQRPESRKLADTFAREASSVSALAAGVSSWQWSTLDVAPPRGSSAYDAQRSELVNLGSDGSTWRFENGGWAFVARQTFDRAPAGCSQLAYDGGRREVVYFSGLSTWTWNGTVWTKKAPATTPPSRTSMAIAYDAMRDVVVLFGGVANSDTYTWNGTTWTRASTVGPPARSRHAMAYDAVRREVVLYGGETYSTSTPLNDTWVWNGSTWVQRATGATPSQRLDAGMTFDIARGRVVLAGATNDGGPRSTWTWNGTAWSQAPDGPNVASSSLAFDPARGEASVRDFDATTWHWNGTTWRSQRDWPPLPLTRPAYDAARKELVLVTNDSAAGRMTTYIWNGRNWASATPATAPPLANTAAMFYDEARGNVVAVVHPLNDSTPPQTWTWEGGMRRWTRATPSGTLPSLGVAYIRQISIAFDRMRGVGVLVLLDEDDGFTNTFTWNGSSWTDTGKSLPFSVLSTPFTAVYDANHLKKVIVPGFVGTYAWDGSNWSTIPVATPSSIDAWVVADPVRGDVVDLVMDEGVYEWNGATWTLAMVATGPSYYDSAMHDGRAVLVENEGAFHALSKLGGTCATDSDCPGAFCTDSVCCGARACNTCETCASMVTPGQCQAVKGAEDPDTCGLAAGKTCDAAGQCRGAQGTSAAAATDCASGFLADGVCCSEACTGNCQACRADLKSPSAMTPSGVCGFAALGSDPREDCPTDDPTTCQRDGACDGRGACRLRPAAVACGATSCVDNRATGRLCDGLGSCVNSAEGVQCETYACVAQEGCRPSCKADTDCAARAHCEAGVCIANEGATCVDERTLRAPDGATTDCGFYRCEASQCKTSCASIFQCSFPNQCSDGKCIPYEANDAPVARGCSAARGDRAEGAMALALALALGRRRTRAVASRR